MRTSNCKLCGIILRNKIRGRPKVFCPNCSCAIQRQKNEDYRMKYRIRINRVSRAYRETHRIEIRSKSTEWYRKKRKQEVRYNTKLIDDILSNPRKYLKRL